MRLNLNQRIERAIIRKLVAELGTSGWYPVRVNFDATEGEPALTVKEVLEHVFSVDQSTIEFQKLGTQITRGVFVVCGNGEDIISDYHAGPKDFTDAIDRVCIIAGEDDTKDALLDAALNDDGTVGEATVVKALVEACEAALNDPNLKTDPMLPSVEAKLRDAVALARGGAK